jgi:hypothetical protein
MIVIPIYTFYMRPVSIFKGPLFPLLSALDLSVLWDAWLDLTVSEEDYALEAIERAGN